MNELDSDIMKGVLLKKNYQETKDEQEADLIILNTCSVRKLAESKVFHHLHMLKNHPKNPIIGLAGCMAMTQKEYLVKTFPHLNFILGPNNIHHLNEFLTTLDENQSFIKVQKDFTDELDYFDAQRSSNLKAYVSIIRGCNNFCSYCIVPFTRGREVSRPSQNILEECVKLADQGYKEITLLGQNVNSYGKDFNDNKMLFHDLLYKINDIPGIERIRFLTSHPKDISKELIYAIRDLDKVCEFIHFPMQCGSNTILKRMNRKYTYENYLEKVYQIKELIPNATIGTDIIVGFPGETEEDFEKTMQAFKEIQFSLAYIFAYSPRDNTLAAKFEDLLSKEEKLVRVNQLQKLYKEIGESRRKAMIGQTEEVLVERLNKDGKMLKGKTRRFEKVIFEGDESLIGSLQKVRLDSFRHETFIASKI